MASGGAPVLMKASLNSGDCVTSFAVRSSKANSLGLASAQPVCTAHDRDEDNSGMLVLKTLLTGGAASVWAAKMFLSLKTVSTRNLSFNDNTPVIGNAPTSASPLNNAV